MRQDAEVAPHGGRGDDFAYGHEMCAGFQRVFEDAGGRVVQKMFSPLAVPDYATYIAQLKTNIDGVFLGFAGSNGFRFLRQFNEYGLRGKVNVVGGMTALDEAVLRNRGDEALGIQTACWYSAELANPQPELRRRSARSSSTTPASTQPRPTSTARCSSRRLTPSRGKWRTSRRS
jgi:ABC-type branched-subunit amino acid transport system substrate-binding protein